MSVNSNSNRKLRLALIYSGTFAGVALAVYLFVYMIQEGVGFTGSGNAHCYLHGMMQPKYNQKNEETSLYDMLRLNFDAAERTKCERMIVAYCNYNVREKGYSPANLKGVFKPDVRKPDTIQYTLTESCKLVTNE